jgi:hypothetical protein
MNIFAVVKEEEDTSNEEKLGTCQDSIPEQFHQKIPV